MQSCDDLLLRTSLARQFGAAKRSRQDLRVGDKLPRRLHSGIVNAGHDFPI